MSERVELKNKVKEYFIKNSDELEVLEVEELDKKCSLFGNYFISITNEQLKELQEGKVLFEINEYGVCIMLKQKAKEFCDE